MPNPSPDLPSSSGNVTQVTSLSTTASLTATSAAIHSASAVTADHASTPSSSSFQPVGGGAGGPAAAAPTSSHHLDTTEALVQTLHPYFPHDPHTTLPPEGKLSKTYVLLEQNIQKFILVTVVVSSTSCLIHLQERTLDPSGEKRIARLLQTEVIFLLHFQ